jgi:hypothetical protein
MFFGGGAVIKLRDEVIGSTSAVGAQGPRSTTAARRRGSTKSAIG